MSTNSIFIAKGTSGTGKGTRVNQLLKFLKSENYDCEKIIHKYTFKGKPKEIVLGYYFKEVNIFIFGTYVKSNKSGLESLSSLDAYHATFGGQGFRDILKQKNTEYSNTLFMMEGYPLVISPKYRPIYFYEELGIRNFLAQYYYYNDNKDDYLKRIFNRSGRFPKGNAAWFSNSGSLYEGRAITGECKMINSKYEKSIMDKRACPHDYNKFTDKYLNQFKVELLPFDASITTVGELVITQFLKDPILLDKFLSYSKNTNCFRSIENPI